MKTFLDWLEKNKNILEGYSVQEISDLAVAAGFDHIVTAQWQTQMKFKGVS